jgi:hypothetical protein
MRTRVAAADLKRLDVHQFVFSLAQLLLEKTGFCLVDGGVRRDGPQRGAKGMHLDFDFCVALDFALQLRCALLQFLRQMQIGCLKSQSL